MPALTPRPDMPDDAMWQQWSDVLWPLIDRPLVHAPYTPDGPDRPYYLSPLDWPDEPRINVTAPSRPTSSLSKVSFQLYLAAVTRDEAFSCDPGDDAADIQEVVDALFAMVEGPDGAQIRFKNELGVVLAPQLPSNRVFWQGESCTRNLGIGPGNFMDASLVKDFADMIQSIDRAVTADRMAPRLNRTSPALIDSYESGVWECVEQTIALYRRAASAGKGMIGFLNKADR